MSKKSAAAYEARLAELDAIRRIHEADIEDDDFTRNMARRFDDMTARYERMVDEKLAQWAAEDMEQESPVSKRETRPPVTVPEDELAEPDWARLTYDDYVHNVRPGLDIDGLGQGGIFW